jgi:thymidylate kinase
LGLKIFLGEKLMSQLAFNSRSLSIDVKSKVIGILLVSLPIVILVLFERAFVQYFPLLIVGLSLIIVLPFCLLLVLVGIKLILYPSKIPVSIKELRKRVLRENLKAKNQKYPAVINLCGVDGSGKTTQIELIENDLRKTKLKCKYLYLRWAAFISYPVLAFCRIMGYTRWKTSVHGVRYVEHHFYKNKAIAKLWSWLFTIDEMLRSTFYIKISTGRGCIVLCDRNTIDALVDLMVETCDYNIWKKPTGKLLLSVVPKNSVTLLLDINELKAYERKNDIPNIDYICVRRKKYLELAHRLGIRVLDANKTKEELHAELVEILRHRPFWFFKSKID